MNSFVEVVFWDVQHGNAAYIKSPNEKHIAIDLGTGSYGDNDSEFSPLLHLEDEWNVNQLDYLIITHPHKDHIDDILNFDKKPRMLLCPDYLPEQDIMKDIRSEDIPTFEEYFEVLQTYNQYVSPTDPYNPKIPENYGGLDIKTFSTDDCSTSNINNHSIVTIISYAGTKIIFPGDNESCSWNGLLGRHSFKAAVKDADILLAPHHGRENGYHNDLINLINPRLTIVSDGRFCDTSANRRYSEKSRGWVVHRRSGESITRKCLTTNNDGAVFLRFGYNSKREMFLYVTID